MRKQIQNIIFITIFISLFSCSPKPDANAVSNFIIISIDALHPSAISEKSSPFIFSLVKKGVATINGSSIKPPLTLYNHAAMFTGLTPKESGQATNNWQTGEKRIQHDTIFKSAYERGLNTAYFYSKPKLGYLVTKNIKKHKFSGVNSIQDAAHFIMNNNNTFTFLHVSGLDFSGKKSGWLSKPYMAIFREIDSKLQTLLNKIIIEKKFIIIITSDHAGHEKIHGTEHPDDYTLPFIFYSDYKTIQPMKSYKVTELKKIVDNLLKK